MRKPLFFLLFFLVVTALYAEDITTIMNPVVKVETVGIYAYFDQNSNRIVVKDTPYYAAGLVMNSYKTLEGRYESKILTVAHINHGNPVYVKGKVAKVELIDFQYDRMILTADFQHKHKIKLLPENGKYTVGEKVKIVGYHRGEKMIWETMIGKIRGIWIYLGKDIPRGVSGGGVFNKKDELIGMMIGKDPDDLGASVAIAQSIFFLREFLYGDGTHVVYKK